MGNYSSCFVSKSTKTNVAKLVDTLGQLRVVQLPITVAEIMLEHPGFALSAVEDLRRTHRLTAMRADERLVGRKVYLLVPIDRVNSRLSDLQLAAVETIVCPRKSKLSRGSSKVSPVVGTSISSEGMRAFVDNLGQKQAGEIFERKKLGKSWSPVLEPILEGC